MRQFFTKSVIGYVVLCIGVILALIYSNDAYNKSLQSAKDKGSVVRQVLCEQLTEGDTQLYKFIHEHPPGSGGFADLLTPALVAESLEESARKREKLGYDPHPEACSGKITSDPYKAADKPTSGK